MFLSIKLEKERMGVIIMIRINQKALSSPQLLMARKLRADLTLDMNGPNLLKPNAIK